MVSTPKQKRVLLAIGGLVISALLVVVVLTALGSFKPRDRTMSTDLPLCVSEDDPAIDLNIPEDLRTGAGLCATSAIQNADGCDCRIANTLGDLLLMGCEVRWSWNKTYLDVNIPTASFNIIDVSCNYYYTPHALETGTGICVGLEMNTTIFNDPYNYANITWQDRLMLDDYDAGFCAYTPEYYCYLIDNGLDPAVRA